MCTVHVQCRCPLQVECSMHIVYLCLFSCRTHSYFTSFVHLYNGIGVLHSGVLLLFQCVLRTCHQKVEKCPGPDAEAVAETKRI